jgi:peroxiredoxin Q/BCP
MPEPNPLAPQFQLTDTNGDSVRLRSFRGKENVILVFNRGLACAFCRRHMHLLRREYEAFRKRHSSILVIAPDRPDALRDFWAQEGFPFPALADPDHRVAGMYNQTVEMFGRGRMPLVVVVSWDGRIRFRHEGGSEADIPSNATLLREVDIINREPPETPPA